MDVPAIDLGAVYRRYQAEFDEAITRVLASGQFVLGNEVRAFETALAHATGVDRAVGLASGTDALELGLRACGVRSGDLVVTVSHTATATVAAVERAGAVPYLIDVDPHWPTMDPDRLAEALAGPAAEATAVVPVHLYGLPAAMGSIGALAEHHGVPVVEDAAQAHGATLDGRSIGSLGRAAAFSFYPTKNLGAFGDGGALVTNDPAVADQAVALRQYGWGPDRLARIPGVNSRLDELQAAILRVRLGHLDEETAHRRRLATVYDETLAGHPSLDRPELAHPLPGAAPVFHQYVVRVPARSRPAVQEELRTQGIGTAIHYPVPVHLQPAYRGRVRHGPLPQTEAICRSVLSLPMGLHVTEDQARRVAQCLCRTMDERHGS
jgi:dTDP-4-amino-4,6-dideoxygalactose transaminase